MLHIKIHNKILCTYICICLLFLIFLSARHQDGPKDGLGHHRGAGRGWADGGGAGGRQGPRQQGGGCGLRGVLGSHPGGHRGGLQQGGRIDKYLLISFLLFQTIFSTEFAVEEWRPFQPKDLCSIL